MAGNLGVLAAGCALGEAAHLRSLRLRASTGVLPAAEPFRNGFSGEAPAAAAVAVVVEGAGGDVAPGLDDSCFSNRDALPATAAAAGDAFSGELREGTDRCGNCSPFASCAPRLPPFRASGGFSFAGTTVSAAARAGAAPGVRPSDLALTALPVPCGESVDGAAGGDASFGLEASACLTAGGAAGDGARRRLRMAAVPPCGCKTSGVAPRHATDCCGC